MTTTHFPDVSAYQAGISLSGAAAAAIKATEGVGWISKDYAAAMARAHSAGAFPFAYHFLRAGNVAGQADYCWGITGATPLMLDWEPFPKVGSFPSAQDAAGFIDRFRARGGICNLLYFPEWYWGQIGKPSLSQFANRGMRLWSSNYTYYTDDSSGAGWHPYGGMTPAIWQYTASRAFNGYTVDFNAFRGSVSELAEIVTGKAIPPPPPAPAFPYPAGHYLGQPSPSPYCHSGYYGGPDHTNVHSWQRKMSQRGWIIAQDGQFGPGSEKIARQFQHEKGLAVDGRVGRDTWTATWNAPVT